MIRLALVLVLLGCETAPAPAPEPEPAPAPDPGPDPEPEPQPEPELEPAPEPCAPKRCTASGDTWRHLVRSVGAECHASARRLTPPDLPWAERAVEEDSFHVIRSPEQTEDDTVTEVATLSCTVSVPGSYLFSAVWVAFATESGWHGCELITDFAQIYVTENTPRQIHLDQWIEGGPPEVITRVTSVADMSDGGESDSSTTADLHVCGLSEGEPVCWGSVQTEAEHSDGHEECDDAMENCVWLEGNSTGRLHVEPGPGDVVRLVRGEGALADREREVHVTRLPCP